LNLVIISLSSLVSENLIAIVLRLLRSFLQTNLDINETLHDQQIGDIVRLQAPLL